MLRNLDKLPELVFADDNDTTTARRVRRLAAAGELRRLYAGVYTANLDSPMESIVLRHWRAIVGHLLPGGVLSHRSAFDAKPHDGMLVVTRGMTRRILELPGLRVNIVPGPGPHETQPANDAPYGALFLASDPRRHLENLTQGRGWSQRVLPQADIENSLDRVLMVGGEYRLNQLRDQARQLAQEFGYQAQFKRLDALIGGLLGTQDARKLTAAQSLARAAGRPYDPSRLPIFDALFAVLGRDALPDIEDCAPSGAARENFAFFEAYFSNYIEGTTFTVEEAEAIIFRGQIIDNRSADSHDMLGTFTAASQVPWRDRPPMNADDFLDWLRNVNALVMQKRPDKMPGEWKNKPNQAGNTYFVAPELVPGTLNEGFARIQALTHPLARAVRRAGDSRALRRAHRGARRGNVDEDGDCAVGLLASACLQWRSVGTVARRVDPEDRVQPCDRESAQLCDACPAFAGVPAAVQESGCLRAGGLTHSRALRPVARGAGDQ